MKKLYIILSVFFLIVLTSFVSAGIGEDLEAVARIYYAFEDDAANTNIEDLTDGNHNGTHTINTDQASIAGFFDDTKAFDYPGANYSDVPFGITDPGNCTNISISFFVKMDTFVASGRILAKVDYNAPRKGINLVMETESPLDLSITYYQPAGTSNIFSTAGTYLSVGEWYHFVLIFAQNNQSIYINGTVADSGTEQGVEFYTIYNLHIGTNADTHAYNLDGKIDEFALFCGHILNQAEIDYLGSNQLFAGAPTFITPPPTIAPPSPSDNSHNNTNVTLNVSHSTTQNDVNYYLYFGISSTLIEADLFLNNVTRSGDEYSNFTTNVSDGTYYWKWKVQNLTDGLFSANTTQRTLYIDTVTPTITRLASNNWRTDNTTILSPFLENLTINISFFDIYLYQTLINITNSSGNSVYNYSNTSITQTTDNNSKTLNLSGWPIGDYTIKLEAVDSHTAIQISDYDIKYGLNYFRYTTKEGNVIKIKSDTFPLTKNTIKFKDRYDFKFNYLFQKDTYKFIIESYNKIDYLKDSGYKAHFVIMGSNGGNWVDFENPNLNSKDYKIIKIDDYTYEIEITANGIKSFTFNSIGGLNRIEKHYLLRLGAVLDVWVYDEENYPRRLNGTLTIGTQTANFTNTSAGRLVNITKDITSLTLTSSSFGTEEKTISLTEKYHNLSFNMTVVLSTKLYFYDEKSEALIEGETFSVYLETTGFSQTYSSIITNPYTITLLSAGLYKLKAFSTNYPERQYLDLNISNQTTTILNIYLINNTLGHEVTFTVQGSGGEALDNADIDFFRIINGTNTLIAKENTDFAGKAKLYLDSNYEYDLTVDREGYFSRNLSLEPSETEYTIILLSGEAPFYQNVYAGVRFRFYHNGIMSISPPDILNLTNTTQNITFEVEGADVAEIGINFTNHNYICTPASCSATLAGAGKVKLGILLNESGTFNTAFYFQKTGEERIYVNDGLIKVIPFIFASLDSLPEWITAMKEELSPNVRTILVAMLNVIAVGVGSSLGLVGAALILPVLAVNIICSLPEIGLIHPFIGMIISIFGVAIYVYAQSR